MRPTNLKTKIFLDSGDPAETREAIRLLGFLDGQTTNPSLVAKNPETQGKKFGEQEILDFYKQVVREVSALIPQGSVSIEVYADPATSASDMLRQGREFFQWIPNAHIKFPTTIEGLKAAVTAIAEGIRVNMTLCFSQAQAAAIYVAFKTAKPGDVFISPFVGRLDDRGENGMDVIKNIMQMYREAQSPVEVLTASVRNLNHLLYAIKLGSDIATVPLKILKDWAEQGLPLPDDDFQYAVGELKTIPYQKLNLSQPRESFDLHHDLTDAGIVKFAADWNSLIQ